MTIDMTLILGADLTGTRYTHLFHPPSSSRPKPFIIHASHVTNESGTGLVHMAPVHGHEDYYAFMNAGLLPEDIQCPVDDDGRFADTLPLVVGSEAKEIKALVGQKVLGEGNAAVVELLKASGTLLAERKITHRYPYDWKTKTPTIIR